MHVSGCTLARCDSQPLPARNFVAFEVPREEEFSPLKNGDLSPRDSPTTARQALLWQHYRWAVQAGARFLNVNRDLLLDQPPR